MESPTPSREPQLQPTGFEVLKRKVGLALFERKARRRIKKFIRESDNPNENYNRNILLGGDKKLYIRKSHRYYDHKEYTMFDVATVSFPEKDWSKGKFGRLMKVIDELNPWDGVRIESITNPTLTGWAERRKQESWQLKPNSDRVQPTYYRLNTPN